MSRLKKIYKKLFQDHKVDVLYELK